MLDSTKYNLWNSQVVLLTCFSWFNNSEWCCLTSAAGYLDMTWWNVTETYPVLVLNSVLNSTKNTLKYCETSDPKQNIFRISTLSHWYTTEPCASCRTVKWARLTPFGYNRYQNAAYLANAEGENLVRCHFGAASVQFTVPNAAFTISSHLQWCIWASSSERRPVPPHLPTG